MGIIKSMAVVLVTIAVTAAPALAQEFYQRRAAHNAGDYAAALGHWRPLAEKSHADAQAALGYMYWNGQGVTQDDATATDWYLRAARQQQPNVVYALGTMYLAGEGVQKDYLRAYVLCNVALAGGNARGLHCHDDAAHYLTKAEKERAANMVVKWQELSAGQ